MKHKTRICLIVNGKERDYIVPDNILLVDWLREELGLTGTKIGCDGGECTGGIDVNEYPQYASYDLNGDDNIDIVDVDNIVIDGTLYSFADGYHPVDTLDPGKGYWVRANNLGNITFMSN